MGKLIRTYDIVKSLLEEKVQYRDDDELLTVRFWWDEIRALNLDPKVLLAKDFLVLVKDRKITPADIITRARRKVSEENIHLRGNKYKERKKKQTEIKAEIRELS